MGLTVNDTKPKPVALFMATEDILSFMWRDDQYEYPHPRLMVQDMFTYLVMSHIGLRPGEIIETSMYHNSNEGIHYGDVNLSVSVFNGELRFEIKISLRKRKGQRGLKSK